LPSGHALSFDPARAVTGELAALVPTPVRGVFAAQANPLLWTYAHPFAVGKVVARGEELEAALLCLERAAEDGPPFWARCDAVRIAPALWLVRWTLPGAPVRVDWAYPFADANGAARTERPPADPELGSWFENQVELDEPGARFGRHSLLKVPAPPALDSSTESAAFDPARLRATLDRELVVVPGELLDEDAPFLVVRKASSWRALQEDVRIDRQARFDAASGEPLAVLISAEIDPGTLLDLLAALHGVRGSAALPAAEEQAELGLLRARAAAR
jgi:hypothetical protein